MSPESQNPFQILSASTLHGLKTKRKEKRGHSIFTEWVFIEYLSYVRQKGIKMDKHSPSPQDLSPGQASGHSPVSLLYQKCCSVGGSEMTPSRKVKEKSDYGRRWNSAEVLSAGFRVSPLGSGVPGPRVMSCVTGHRLWPL